MRTPLLASTSSNTAVNLLSRSRIRKRTGVARSVKLQASWRACWVTQGAVWVGRAVGEVDTPAAKLDEDEHVEPLQPDRFDGEEVDGDGTGERLYGEDRLHRCGTELMHPTRASYARAYRAIPDAGSAKTGASARSGSRRISLTTRSIEALGPRSFASSRCATSWMLESRSAS
jgi:hypothetical protein